MDDAPASEDELQWMKPESSDRDKNKNKKKKKEEGEKKKPKNWQVLGFQFEDCLTPHLARGYSLGGQRLQQAGYDDYLLGNRQPPFPWPHVLVPLTQIEEQIPPALAIDDHKSRDTLLRQAASIVNELPTFAPATGLIPASLGGSARVEFHARDKRVTYSDLLTVGRIHDSQKRKWVGVVATAAGASGGSVAFYSLKKFAFDAQLGESEKNEYVTWKLAQGRLGLWNHNSTPIKQLNFSSEHEKVGDRYGNILAVRFEDSVALFRPEIRTEPLRPLKSRLKPASSRMPVSCLDPGFFAEIEAKELSGAPLAHFALHPGKNRIALIDVRGHWAVWNFHFDSKKDSVNQDRPVKMNSGFLVGDIWSSELPEHVEKEPWYYDGFGKVAWTHSGGILVVTRRRNAVFVRPYIPGAVGAKPLRTTLDLMLLDLEKFIRNEYDNPELTDNFIDIKQCPIRPCAIWILTSRRLFSVSNRWWESRNKKKMEIDFAHSVGHHLELGETATDWVLDVFAFGSTIITLIRGKQHLPVLMRKYQVNDLAKHSCLTTAGSPHSFRLAPLTSHGHKDSTSLLGIFFLPVLRSSEAPGSSFPQSAHSQVPLFSTLYCLDGLAVASTILAFQHKDASDIRLGEFENRSRSSSTSSGRSVQDDFLVDDDLVSDDGEDILMTKRKIRPIGGRRRTTLQHIHQAWLANGYKERPPQVDAAAKMIKILTDIPKGLLELNAGSHTALALLGGENHPGDLRGLDSALGGLLQRSFKETLNANNRHSTSVELMKIPGISTFWRQLLNSSSSSSIAEILQACEEAERFAPYQPDIGALLARNAQITAQDALLTNHKLVVTASGLNKLDSVQSDSVVTKDTVKQIPAPTDLPSSSTSTLPPLPSSQDVYDPTIGEDLVPPTIVEPHPYPSMAALGILGSDPDATNNLSQVRELWKLRQKPTGRNWRLYGSHSRAIGPEFLPQKESDQDKLRPPTIQSSAAWMDSSQPLQSQQLLSQPRTTQLVHRPSKSPFGSQALTEIAFPGGSQLKSSQTNRVGRKRKAGF